MSGSSVITIVGNVGKDDPVARFTSTGKTVTNFSVAVTPRIKKDGEWTDGETIWYRVTAWDKLGEAVAEGVSAGSPVIVMGVFGMESYEKDGETKRYPAIRADAVGVVPKAAKKPEAKATSEEDPW